jgi:hypothetical protein
LTSLLIRGGRGFCVWLRKRHRLLQSRPRDRLASQSSWFDVGARLQRSVLRQCQVRDYKEESQPNPGKLSFHIRTFRGTMPMGRITATELPSRCCLSSQEVSNCHSDRREISTCFDVISSRSGWRTYSIRCKSFGFDSRPVQERKGTRETGPLRKGWYFVLACLAPLV